MDVFKLIYTIVCFTVTFYIAVTGFLTVVGMFPARRKYDLVEDQLKYCVFVPCHNEGSVIAATVKNLAEIEYQEDLFDVYFIADNCTDDTASQILKAIKETGRGNFHVFVRNVDDPKKKGKPHALRWAIDELEGSTGFYGNYDQFMIFDADNFVDPGILKHVNSQWLSYKENKRPELIQCYLDSKNKDSLVARGYFVGYRVSNRTAEQARATLHLVPPIGGTGFAMTTKFLKEIGGYNCVSLTEDLEIQTIATLNCKSVAFNRHVRIYDEKPTGIRQSVVQRTRWAQGHWYICFKYTWRLFLSLFKPKEIRFFFKKIDMMIYLNSKFFVLASLVFMIFLIPATIYWTPIYFSEYLAWFDVAMMILQYLIIIPVSAIMDGPKKEKWMALIEYFPNLIATIALGVIETVACGVGLLKCRQQSNWAKTTHRVVSMDNTKGNK